jgi:CubicO group peptidase (beta-lactamase class C family)
MVLRHGHVVAEGWWAPYEPSELHLLYSLSKSFTATAAGLAAAEGLLDLDDTVVSHLPDLAEVATHPWTRSMRLRDLAAMATGHHEDTLDRARRLDPDEPVRGFLALPPDAEPGSVFAYNNGATYTLGAVVQRVTGQTLTDYLRPRLLEPLGITRSAWHTHPEGRELGFSGFHLTTEAIARFGQLYLDDGVWQGRRLLPEGWVAEASRVHTPNPAEPNPDWQQGYGYQLWRSRHGYRGDGAYGQFCLVLPEQDAVVVTTAQTEDMQGLIDAVWAHLLPGMGVATPERDAPLAARLAALTLPPDGSGLQGTEGPEAASDLQVTAVAVDPAGGWQLGLDDGTEQVDVACGDGGWRRTSLVLSGGRRLEVAASASSEDGDLVVQLVFLQTPHRLVLRTGHAGGSTTGRWQTVPLHAGTFAGLAVAPPA